MGKYIKRRIEIEAEQFWPDKFPWPEGVVPRDPSKEVNICGAIKTPEGWLTVSPGDWIITGIQGEKYPCKPDIFEATYDVADSIGKSLHNTDVNGAHKNVPDIQVFGDGDMWELLCKASSEREGWMKSTKAMEIPDVGCLVQVTTQQRNPDGSYSVSEAITFVPGTYVGCNEENGVIIGRYLGRLG